MKPGASLLMLVAGAVTSFVTTFLCFFILPFNIIFFMMNGILPLGALGAGFLGFAGYYIAARVLGYRPRNVLTAAMTLTGLIALAFPFFILYHTTGAAAAVSFPEFMNNFMTHAVFSRAGHSGEGTEVGNFGYGLAALQVVGFLAPAVIYSLILRAQNFCEPCDKFYKKIGRLTKDFTSMEAMAEFVKKLGATPPFSYQYADVLAEKTTAEKPVSGSSTQLYHTLYQCPGCKAELLVMSAAIREKGNWSAIRGLKATAAVPPGSTLLSAFGKQVS